MPINGGIIKYWILPAEKSWNDGAPLCSSGQTHRLFGILQKLCREWKRADARYVRFRTGGGKWEEHGKTDKSWEISYRELIFSIRPTGFKHTGLFPEQAVNWDWMDQAIRSEVKKRPVSVLNLFAYTGGATLAAAAAGASVCHVDAAKGMVSWARDNAALSGLSDRPIRWIVDDCKKFVERELRRGHRYDAIIMDPPSYGRGPSGEVWAAGRTDLRTGGIMSTGVKPTAAVLPAEFLHDRSFPFGNGLPSWFHCGKRPQRKGLGR